MARLEGEIAPPTPAREEPASNPTVAGKKPLPLLTPAHKESATAPLPVTFKNSLGMEFVLVPKGKSWLGGGGGKPGDKEVEIAHDFYLGKYEVTQEEWEKVTGLTPSCFSRTGGSRNKVKDIADAELKRFPVENVSWDDAQAFLERLNNAEKGAGMGVSLAEGSGMGVCVSRRSAVGQVGERVRLLLRQTDEPVVARAGEFQTRQVLQRTCKVGSYPPNRLGLYDMHGNVWEWCDDIEKTADGESRHVIHGGSWGYGSGNCQAAFRVVLWPAFWASDTGLRVARVPVAQRGESPLADAAKQADTATVTPNALNCSCRRSANRRRKRPKKPGQRISAATVEISNKSGMQMRLVPPGRFEMGSPETVDQLRQAFPATALILNEFQQLRGERPVHSVTISKPFYLGKYEVTKGQFKQFVDDVGYRTDAEKDGRGGNGYKAGQEVLSWDWDSNYTWRGWGVEQPDNTPVVHVSHNDAMAFCDVAKQEGRKGISVADRSRVRVRLPRWDPGSLLQRRRSGRVDEDWQCRRRGAESQVSRAKKGSNSRIVGWSRLPKSCRSIPAEQFRALRHARERMGNVCGLV